MHYNIAKFIIKEIERHLLSFIIATGVALGYENLDDKQLTPRQYLRA